MINNNLKIEKLPMEIKFGRPANTNIEILEKGIKATLTQYPTWDQLKAYLPNFCKATWEEDPFKQYSDDEAETILIKMFKGETLPTALETIRFTFVLEGLTYIEISHILRYRTASFSALCTADRDQRDDNAAIPASIYQSDKYRERYMDLIHEMKELYTEMVDDKEISIFDARYILPKASTVYYHMSINFKDLMGFIKGRIDRAIQPQTDNILAYRMWLELCKVYPILTTLDLVDFDAPSWFFIKTHTSGHCSNIYQPEEHNAKHFEYNEKSFMYEKTRPEMCGTNKGARYIFNDIKEKIEKEIEKIKDGYLYDRYKRFMK